MERQARYDRDTPDTIMATKYFSQFYRECAQVRPKADADTRGVEITADDPSPASTHNSSPLISFGCLGQAHSPVLQRWSQRSPPLALETMLRVHFLQQWFNLSDPAIEEAFFDTPL